MSREPNILFLLSDEHNAKCLGHVDGSTVRTPSLDRLADQGTRFTRAVTQSPICTPSRISFASGQYPHNHGYYGLAGETCGPSLVDRVPHLFGHLKQHGYAIGAVGKSHLPPGWIESGCDRFVEDKDPDQGYPAFLRDRGIDPDRSAALSWGKRIKADGANRFGHDFGPDDLPYEQSVEHWEASEAIAFLEAHQDRPMFLQVGFWRPHTPCTPSPEFWEMYPDESLAAPPNIDYSMAGQPAMLREQRAQLEAMEAERYAFEPRTYQAMRRRYLRGYYGCITQMDRAIGEVLDALDRLGLADDTIVVYSSDHGDFAMEHGLTEKVPGIWSDAVTRIPMIWRWPGRVEAGHVSDCLVESVDLAPTVCSLTGIEAMPTADGVDLTPLMQGGETPLRDVAVTENPRTRSVYDQRYRLVHTALDTSIAAADGDRGALYDHREDPWEMRNLIDDPGHGDVVAELRRRLLDHTLATTRVATTHPSLDRAGRPFGKASGGRKHRVDGDGKRGPAYIDAVARWQDRYL